MHVSVQNYNATQEADKREGRMVTRAMNVLTQTLIWAMVLIMVIFGTAFGSTLLYWVRRGIEGL